MLYVQIEDDPTNQVNKGDLISTHLIDLIFHLRSCATSNEDNTTLHI